MLDAVYRCRADFVFDDAIQGKMRYMDTPLASMGVS